MKTQTKDYYRLLGVRPMPPCCRSRRPTASWPSSTTRTSTTAPTPLSGSGRSPKPTTPSPTRTGAAATTGSTASGMPPPARTTDRPGTTGPATAHAPDGSANGNSSPMASRIIKVLEDTWLEIRRWNPEIPAVVIIIASGTDGKHPRWGHHAPGRWNVAGEQLTEIMISGEGLRRTAREVLGTLLHEAAHALAHARGIKDTSRQGRYHNKQFKTCAEEVGLAVEHDDNFGWSVTTITPATELAYAPSSRPSPRP